MDNIVCPHCGKNVQLSEAIIHQLQSKVRNEERKKIEAQFEEQKAKEAAKRETELREEFEKESKSKQRELDELEKKLEKQEKDNAQREEKIKAQAQEEATKQVRLEKLELEKKLKDTQEALENAQRKAKQGSQQLQGEVLELDLEEKLKTTFKYDLFLPVPKGVKGADIIQQVRNKFGKVASTIIWEFKRTKTWDKKWLEKLREDARVSNANESVIVSDILPDNIKIYGKIDGVWVTNLQYAIPLATILREMGIRIAVAKSGAQHDDTSLKKIHDYILSEKFRHKVEKDVETVTRSLEMLEKKHNVDEKYFRLQKSSLEALKDNTSQIYFDLQEILPALPSIAGLEGDLLYDDEENDQETLL